MILPNLSKILNVAALCGMVLFAAGAQNARADTLSVTALPPGVQTPASTANFESFDNVNPVNGSLTSNFNGSSVTGTYTGNFGILSADAYGGANGSKFISTTGANSAYTLSLNKGVKYFGLWFSALDKGNSLTFYNGKDLVGSLMPSNFVGMVGTCSGKSNAYCGNPNNGLDAAEQFAYLNFYDATGTFNKIVFGQSGGVGQLESDNQAVGTLTVAPGSGTAVTPEPATLFLFGTGMLGFAGLLRSKLRLSRQLA